MVTRPSSIFSPITPAMSATVASTVAPVSRVIASKASRSATWASKAACAKVPASAWNSSPLATKSVSHRTSTMVLSTAATTPLEAVRSAPLLAALAAPEIRRASTALSKSPSLSSSAFLHSIIPAEVISRSRLTSAALIVAIFFLRVSVGREVRSLDPHVSRLGLRGVSQVDVLRLLGCGVGGCGFCACCVSRRAARSCRVGGGRFIGSTLACEQFTLPLG